MLEAVHPVLMVHDVDASLSFFARLGFSCLFRATEDNPNYAGVRRDAVELHLQWHDEEQWRYDVDRPTYRFVVENVDALHAEFQQCDPALQMTQVMDTDWGTREFHVRDLDGNGLQFYRDA